MATEQGEKSLRLQSLLQEALNPILEKMDGLEQEVAALRKEQETLKQMLEEDKK